MAPPFSPGGRVSKATAFVRVRGSLLLLFWGCGWLRGRGGSVHAAAGARLLAGCWSEVHAQSSAWRLMMRRVDVCRAHACTPGGGGSPVYPSLQVQQHTLCKACLRGRLPAPAPRALARNAAGGGCSENVPPPPFSHIVLFAAWGSLPVGGAGKHARRSGGGARILPRPCAWPRAHACAACTCATAPSPRAHSCSRRRGRAVRVTQAAAPPPHAITSCQLPRPGGLVVTTTTGQDNPNGW